MEMQTKSKMEFFALDNFLTPVRPLIIDNTIMVYNMNAFATNVLNMWTEIGKFTGILFCQCIVFIEKIIELIYLHTDVAGIIFAILLAYVAVDSLMTDYEKNKAENKNRIIEMDDMRAKIEFYEAKHQSYDIIVGELYENVNKLKRTIKKLEREMKKYD